MLTLTDTAGSVALTLPGTFATSDFVVTNNADGAEITISGLIPCFAAGTRIATARGTVPVQRLREGDSILNISGGSQPITWIGHRFVDCRRHSAKHRVWPIQIAPHAFGEGRPNRMLLLSPDHSVFMEDVLIPIKFLVNDTTIRQIEVPTITYYHIELPRHDVMLAEGLPTESYLETGGRNAFENSGRPMQLHPNFEPDPVRVAMVWECHGYAPLLGDGDQLSRVRTKLQSQAAMSVMSRGRHKRTTARRYG